MSLYSDVIKTALSTVVESVFHNLAHKQTASYIVWEEKKLEVLNAEHSLVRFEVHHYTHDEYSAKPAAIILALREAGFTGVKTAAVEFSETTGVTHTLITCAYGTAGDEIVSALVKRVPAGSNEYGTPLWTETSRDVTALLIGRRWSEVYAAVSAGLRPEITLQVYAGDYDAEKVVRFEGVDYQITEAKTTEDGMIEIMCGDIAKAG